MTTEEPRRDKLGLALAGGGFRASLFHLGVLRRMAELDLLRYVEVLSTVSGGSILGALYFLTLKKHLDRSEDGRLTREQYIDITREVEVVMVRGVQKNLRTRLFTNPLGVLRVMLTGHSLGRRMARIYERHLFQEVVQELRPQSRRERWLRPGRVLLSDLHVRPGGKPIAEGIETYNETEVRTGGSAVPLLIMNATSLNSGARFWFSHTEVGDWYLGLVRYSEIDLLLARKRLLQIRPLRVLEEKLDTARGGAEIPIELEGDRYGRQTLSLALWWRRGRPRTPVPEGWEELFAVPGFPGKLVTAAFGALRQLKIPAWYVRKGLDQEQPIRGGLLPEHHLRRFWEALRGIDEDLFGALEPGTGTGGESRIRDLLLDFVLELYWLRSAEVVSRNIKEDWSRLTLGTAVGASACFPPVFPPFLEVGIYDDRHVSLLGLTDGGVFDNIGITALRDEQCNYVVASDTSGPFGVKHHASAGRIELGGRVISIVMGAVAGLQRESLKETRRVSDAMERAIERMVDPGVALDMERFLSPRELKGLAFFHMGSPRLPLPKEASRGLELQVDRENLARLRTDLDAFGDVEIDALVNHGYDTADRYIRKYLAGKELFAPSRAFWSTPAIPPRPVPTDTGRANRIIRVGRCRFFRALKLGAPISWVFSILLFVAVVLLTWNRRLSVDGSVGSLAAWMVAGLDRSILFMDTGWTLSTFSVGWLLISLAVAAVVLLGLGYACTSRRGGRNRGTATVCKWAGLYAGNLLWLVKGLPVILAVGVSIVAWTSHLLFTRPFLAKTRRKS